MSEGDEYNDKDICSEEAMELPQEVRDTLWHALGVLGAIRSHLNGDERFGTKDTIIDDIDRLQEDVERVMFDMDDFHEELTDVDQSAPE